MSRNFWSGKSVFITGHTGFKGSWLTFWLNHLGANVTGFSEGVAHHPSLFEALNLDSLCNDFRGDVRNREQITAAVKDAAPDIIFHLAAQPLVRRSYREPVETFETNILGTVNILEASRSSPRTKALINVTTDKVYENIEARHGYREHDRLGGHDPYSASKVCSEIVTSCYARSFPNDCNPITIRAGNIIGGGDWSEDRLLPDAVRQFSAKSVLLIRNPDAVRPWQHVADALRGYLIIGERAYLGSLTERAYNLGPAHDQVASVSDVLSFAVEFWGRDAAWKVVEESSKLKETNKLLLDSSLAKSELNWRSQLDLRSSIQQTIEWYKLFYARAGFRELRQLTTKQIQSVMGEF